MENAGKFKDELKRLVLRRIVLLTIGATIFFFVSVFLSNYFKYKTMSKENLDYVSSIFREINNHSRDFLLSNDTSIFLEKIIKENDEKSFINYFNRFNRDSLIKAEYIIIDKNWKVKSTSFSGSSLTTSIYNYNNAVANNASSNDKNVIYSSVYNNYEGYPDYMLVYPVWVEDEIVSYISLFFAGSNWSYLISNNNNYYSVVTDYRDNVIFYNKASLITNNYKFSEIPSSDFRIGNDRYWLEVYKDDYNKINVYSIIHYPRSPEMFISFFIIIIIGVLMFTLSDWMSKQMANKNATSVNQLAKEIQYITRSEPLHRIKMDSGDEFEDIGNQINVMLDTIKELNDKNTELIKFNNEIEISQLTAQLNPHFLYNTLDTIRNLVIINPVLAKEVILNLTKVLRYSIDNQKIDVRLKDDLKFSEDYLFIQELRFGNRLKVFFDISDDCLKYYVPKLVLQPLFENSIKYGFMKKTDLIIKVSGYYSDGYLYLTITDNGLGMSDDRFSEVSHQINQDLNQSNSHGLFNISRRLKLQYTNASELKLINLPNEGLQVEMKIFQTMEV